MTSHPPPPSQYPDHDGLQHVHHADGGLEVSVHNGGLEAVAPDLFRPLKTPTATAASASPYWEAEKIANPPQSPAPFHHAQYAENAYSGGYQPVPVAAPPSNGSFGANEPPAKQPESPAGRICGVKRQVFFVIVAITVFFIVVGVALGIGLALGLPKNSDAASSSTSSASPTTASPSNTAFAAPRATATTDPNTTIACPANNQTLYQSRQVSSRSFLVLCGRDYADVGGAEELRSQKVALFSDCIDACARDSACMAAGWGWINNGNTCFLKKSIGSYHASDQWFFAVGQEILRSAS